MLMPFNLGKDITGSDNDDATTECSFCYSSMQNIKATLNKVSNMKTATSARITAASKITKSEAATKVTSKMDEMTPALKEGFAIYCHSQRSGETVKKVVRHCNSTLKIKFQNLEIELLLTPLGVETFYYPNFLTT